MTNDKTTSIIKLYKNFNNKIYRLFNKDLKDLSDDNLIIHYHNHGCRENRISSVSDFYRRYPLFNVNFYKNISKSINNTNNDLMYEYHEKKINGYGSIYGSINEFYVENSTFDMNIYRICNKDLVSLTDNEIIIHYIVHGKNENRIINDKQFIEENKEFDIYFYKNSNKDLISMSIPELIKHYITHGKNEDRIKNEEEFNMKYTNFDVTLYKNKNNLINLTDKEIKCHYMLYYKNDNDSNNNDNNDDNNKNENDNKSKSKIEINIKKFIDENPEFDIKFYKFSNRDLIKLTHSELINHYIVYGKNEDRIINEKIFNTKYPNFNIEKYKEKHEYLKYKTNKEIKCHYILNKEEISKSSEFSEVIEYNEKEETNKESNDFDITYYKNCNKDLYKMTDDELLEHYNKIGKNEDRIINEKAFKDKYPYFDIKLYRENNKSVMHLSDNELRYYYAREYIENKNKLSNIIQKKYTNSSKYKKQNYNINFYKSKNDELEEQYISINNYIIDDIEFQNKYPNFNIKYYKEKNGLLLLTDNEIKNHFIESGKYKKYNDNIQIESNICIIYYYETIKKNKNLLYLIKYGLNKNLWKKYNITLLIIMNTDDYELSLLNNVHIIRETTIHYIECINNGIKYFENITNCKINELFSHIYIINNDVVGPIIDYDENKSNHWIENYLKPNTINTSLNYMIINTDIFRTKKLETIITEIDSNKVEDTKSIFKLMLSDDKVDIKLNEYINSKLQIEPITEIENNYNINECINLLNNVLIYNHSDNDNIIKDYIIKGIKSLYKIGYYIIFNTTCKIIKNASNFPIKINYYEKDDSLNIYLKSLENIKTNNLENLITNILLMDDSILLPIHGIKNMENHINAMRKKYDFWGLFLSYNKKMYIETCFIEFKIEMLDEVMIYLKDNLNIEDNYIGLTEHLYNCGYNYNAIINYKHYVDNIKDELYQQNESDEEDYKKDIDDEKYENEEDAEDIDEYVIDEYVISNESEEDESEDDKGYEKSNNTTLHEDKIVKKWINKSFGIKYRENVNYYIYKNRIINYLVIYKNIKL